MRHNIFAVVLAILIYPLLNYTTIIDRHSTKGVPKEFIGIHYTANPSAGGTATNTALYLQRKRKAGAHTVLDDTETIITAYEWQSVPSVGDRYWKGFTPKPWLVNPDGTRKVLNKNTFSIEMCLGWDRDNLSIIEKTAAMAGWHLVNKGLSTGHLVRHHDVTGKYCPFFGSIRLSPAQWKEYVKNPVGSGYFNKAYEDRHWRRFIALVEWYRDYHNTHKQYRLKRLPEDLYKRNLLELKERKPVFVYE